MSKYKHDIVHIDRNPDNIINEAYIGKTETLLKIEKKLHEIRKGINILNASSTTKEVLELNRLFEKQFGMDIFALKILKTNEEDAYTLSIGRNFDMVGKDMRSYVSGNTVSGYRFTKGNGLCIVVNISVGFLANPKYTDEDIMYIILHEVGHNFADCLYGELELYNKTLMKQYKDYIIGKALFKAVISIALSLYTLNPVPAVIGLTQTTIKASKQLNDTTAKNTYNKEKKNQKKPRSNRVKNFLKGITGNIKDTGSTILSVIDRYFGITSSHANQYKAIYTDEDKNEIKNSIDRRSEVIADKFPVIYGYSVAGSYTNIKMVSIVDKRDYKATRKLGKYAQKMNDIYEESIFDLNDFDSHPNALQRMNVELNTLKNEFNKEDIDPRVKEELKYQIEEIQKNIDDLADSSKKIYKVEKAQSLYYAYVKQTAPDAINQEIEAEIDDILDKVLEEQEKKHK